MCAAKVGFIDPKNLKPSSAVAAESQFRDGSQVSAQTSRSNHFVAIMPFRMGPRSGVREFLTVPTAEDHMWYMTREGPNETDRHLARLEEGGRLTFIPKFIGGTNKEDLQEDKYGTISRELYQEANIFIDPEQFWAETLFTHEELVSGYVIPGKIPEQRMPDHHKYFLLFDAERCWRAWKNVCRQELKIEMPHILPKGSPGRQRPPEILGQPTWYTEHQLRNILHQRHIEAFEVAVRFLAKR